MALFISGPAGRLEAALFAPEEPARAAAVVCHPHPLYGGTMRNTVTFRLARGLQSAGLAVLRFNFRGAGASEGVHDGGAGEIDDAAAALDELAGRYPGLPLWAAGFSFGARTVVELARRDARVARLVCVALPCRAFDCTGILALEQPTLILTAGRDEFGNQAELHARFPDLPPGVETDEIPGVDHFFRGATPELERRIRAHAERAMTP
jgi:alpha/beta superfamily hydrolase